MPEVVSDRLCSGICISLNSRNTGLINPQHELCTLWISAVHLGTRNASPGLLVPPSRVSQSRLKVKAIDRRERRFRRICMVMCSLMTSQPQSGLARRCQSASHQILARGVSPGLFEVDIGFSRAMGLHNANQSHRTHIRTRPRNARLVDTDLIAGLNQLESPVQARPGKPPSTEAPVSHTTRFPFRDGSICCCSN